MTTFAQAIASCRQFLNDTDADRWSEADLLEYANEAVREIRKLRPDIFLGTYSQRAPTYVSTDDLPVTDALEASVKDYIVHRSHMREDEYVVDGRAIAFLNRFRQVVLTT